MIRSKSICVFAVIIGLLIGAGSTLAMESTPSSFALEGQKIRYDVALALSTDEPLVIDIPSDSISQASTFQTKSPAKALLLSLVVPGLGQFYNGSRLKAVGFLGVEISTWVLYGKWHGQADDMTAEGCQ